MRVLRLIMGDCTRAKDPQLPKVLVEQAVTQLPDPDSPDDNKMAIDRCRAQEFDAARQAAR